MKVANDWRIVKTVIFLTSIHFAEFCNPQSLIDFLPNPADVSSLEKLTKETSNLSKRPSHQKDLSNSVNVSFHTNIYYGLD